MIIRIYKGENFNLTPNFTSKEVYDASRPVGGLDYIEIDSKVVDLAQFIRSELDVPVYITSAFRNEAYNNLLAMSSKKSMHIKGMALDLKGEGIVSLLEKSMLKRDVFFSLLRENGLGGVGFYDWGIHVDTKTGAFRNWDYRSLKKKM